MLTAAWTWLDQERVQVVGLCDYPRYAENPEDDYDLVAQAHRLFDEADIVVAHNGTSFDTKKAQARMIIHGFDPPSPFKEFDTLRVARKHFAFNGNSLNDLCRVLGIGEKSETGGFKTWMGCLQGDPRAWATMKRYNRNDVVLLKQLYLRLRPWATTHPNLATLSGKPSICPKCGAEGQMIDKGWNHNKVTRAKKYQCQACRGYCSSRTNERLETSFV
jgi:hypothetical protein